MRKLISVILSTLMIMSNAFCIDFSAYADEQSQEIVNIVVDTKYESFPDENGGEALWSFTPEVDGEYIFVFEYSIVSGKFEQQILKSNGEAAEVIRSTFDVKLNKYYVCRTALLTAGEKYKIIQKNPTNDPSYIVVYYHPEHTFVLSTTNSPNCNQNGSEIYKCSNEYCSAEKIVPIEATDKHHYQMVTKKATCIDYGCNQHKCIYCGFYFETNYVAPNPTAHTYTSDGYCKYCYAKKQPESITELSLENNVSAKIPKTNATVWYSITPSESGYYSLTSGGKYDLYAELYNSSFTPLTYADDISMNNYNFRLSAYFEKDKTYYVEIGSYDTGAQDFTLLFTTHTHKLTTEVIKPDCGNNGCKLTSCECGYYYVSDVTEKTNQHKYSAEVVPPTCAERGYTIRYCETCGDMYDCDFTEATGAHRYEKGMCRDCGKIDFSLTDDTVPSLEENTPLSFNFDSQNNTFYASFKADESRTYCISSEGLYDIDGLLLDENGDVLCYNEDSGKGKNFRISANLEAGHSYMIIAFAPEKKEGEFSLIAQKHTHNFITFVVPATCADGGYTRYTCKACTNIFEADYTEPTDEHIFVNGKCAVCSMPQPTDYNIISEGSLTKKISHYEDGIFIFTPKHNGTMTFFSTGTVCPLGSISTAVDNDSVLYREEPVDDMNFKFVAELEAGKTYYFFASATDNEYEVHFNYDFQHNYDNGKVTKKATCTNDGVKTYTCRFCGEAKTESIEKLEHIYRDVVTKAKTTADGKIENKCTMCGDVTSSTAIAYPKTIKLSATSYTYDGKVKKPSVKVTDSKGKAISASNYTVAYSYNKNVGKATVKITFKGNYSGTKTLNFIINPKGTTIASIAPASKAITVKWKKQTTQTTGYQIQYATNSKFTSAKTVTVGSNKTVSKKITKLTGKKKYYVRIRTYKTVSGTKYYSAWSKAKTVTTK